MYIFFGLMMAAAAGERPVVEVFLPPFMDQKLNKAMGRAQGIVLDAYAEIGIRVVWHSASSLPSDCVQTPMHRQIVFDLSTGAAGRSQGALAFANPYSKKGACVTLLIDRLKDSAERNPDTTGIVMGHVLAHEIGHVLQGIARHSETGLMKERWSVKEIQEMWRARLRFTAYDAELIMESLRRPLADSVHTVQVSRIEP